MELFFLKSGLDTPAVIKLGRETCHVPELNRKGYYQQFSPNFQKLLMYIT